MSKFDNKISSILKYNKILNRRFWKNDKFNEEIGDAIMKIVRDFIEDDDHIKPDMIDDIRLTGSLANYNYNKYSDLDVHIILDFKRINKDENLVRRFLNGKRMIWNMKHNIILQKDHEVELYFQDVDEPHTASGIYSFITKKWIVHPKNNKPEIDKKEVQEKVDYFYEETRLLEDLLDNVDDPNEIEMVHSRAEHLKEKLQKMRKSGLERSGEYSAENLVFKALRNNNTIEKLFDIINSSYDMIFNKDKSLNEEIDIEDETEEEEEKKLGFDAWTMKVLKHLYRGNPALRRNDPPQKYPIGL